MPFWKTSTVLPASAVPVNVNVVGAAAFSSGATNTGGAGAWVSTRSTNIEEVADAPEVAVAVAVTRWSPSGTPTAVAVQLPVVPVVVRARDLESAKISTVAPASAVPLNAIVVVRCQE